MIDLDTKYLFIDQPTHPLSTTYLRCAKRFKSRNLEYRSDILSNLFNQRFGPAMKNEVSLLEEIKSRNR